MVGARPIPSEEAAALAAPFAAATPEVRHASAVLLRAVAGALPTDRPSTIHVFDALIATRDSMLAVADAIEAAPPDDEED